MYTRKSLKITLILNDQKTFQKRIVPKWMHTAQCIVHTFTFRSRISQPENLFFAVLQTFF